MFSSKVNGREKVIVKPIVIKSSLPEIIDDSDGSNSSVSINSVRVPDNEEVKGRDQAENEIAEGNNSPRVDEQEAIHR